jgi:hypothetical protein
MPKSSWQFHPFKEKPPWSSVARLLVFLCLLADRPGILSRTPLRVSCTAFAHRLHAHSLITQLDLTNAFAVDSVKNGMDRLRGGGGGDDGDDNDRSESEEADDEDLDLDMEPNNDDEFEVTAVNDEIDILENNNDTTKKTSSHSGVDSVVNGDLEAKEPKTILRKSLKAQKAMQELKAQVKMKAATPKVSIQTSSKSSSKSIFQIPYLIQAIFNPFIMWRMTKGYWQSLFNLDYLKEVSVQNYGCFLGSSCFEYCNS